MFRPLLLMLILSAVWMAPATAVAPLMDAQEAVQTTVRLDANPQFAALDTAGKTQIPDISGQTDEGQVLMTGKSTAQAIMMSIVPGAGQIYNGDLVLGSIFLIASAGLIVLDNFVPYLGLAGFPGLAIVSAIHAGLTTQETLEIK